MPIRHCLLAAALVVAACAAGGVRLTQQEIAPTYSPGEFAYAGAGRDMRVVVVGNPFGGDRAAFESAVTDAMQGRHWGQRTNFTTTPGPSAYARYRVVLLFDPPRSLNGARLCREDPSALPSESTGEGIVLFAAFCRGKRTRTEIKGLILSAAGPDDPAFRELVGQVTNGLFPPDRGIDREPGSPRWIWS
ncbi:MAG: hypothetical protein KAR37_09195 [Alphaproteobacteria bacterium]|nr:hypothetical protein [Alphaproteobacteria bacterium]